MGLTATLAAVTGVGVRVVQAGPRSGRIDIEDALDDDQLEAAIATGRQIADAEVDEGADLLIGAVCGVGVSTPVSVLVAVLTGMEPVDATTRGSGIDDAAWITKAAAVRDALFRVRKAGSDVLTLLRTGGGADLAALTGFIAQAAIRRTPVLIHDLPSTVCGVLAHRIAPGADSYLLASSLSPERGHRRLLEILGSRAADRLVHHGRIRRCGVAGGAVAPRGRAGRGRRDGRGRGRREPRAGHPLRTRHRRLGSRPALTRQGREEVTFPVSRR